MNDSRGNSARPRPSVKKASSVTRRASASHPRNSAEPARQGASPSRIVQSSSRSSAGTATATSSAGRGISLKTILLIVAAVVLIAVIGISVYTCNVSNRLHEGVDQSLRNALVKTDLANEPFYMLLMGTDGSLERDEDPDYAGGEYRSDSIMLARIDPVDKKVALVSIHRDTQIDMGEYGVQKLNAARAIGGPAMAVETVSKLAGVGISHYAEVNFDAFCSIVDSIGGVEVDIPIDIDDEDAGGSLSAGLQTLNGEQALILCRARNTYANVAADPDLMRAANQRLVLSAIARKLLSSDPATIAKSVQAMADYVTTDLEVGDIVGLAQTFQGLDPERGIYSAMQPVTAEYRDEIWWSITKEPDWTEMMNRVKNGEPPVEAGAIDETTGVVLSTAGSSVQENATKTAWISIKNGTKREGLATRAGTLLNAAGFVNTVVGEANNTDYRETVIVYDDSAQEYEAKQIADVLGQGKLLKNPGDYIFDGNFLVLIGADWKSN